jgi:hypothetical protein
VTHLALRAWFALVVLAAVMGALLFVPRGTLSYWQAWVYLGIFFGASALTTVFLIRRDPALLERRMRGGPTAEKRTVERFIMGFVSIGFVALLVVPALDYRFGWSAVPVWAVSVGDLLVVLGFYFIFRVYRENTYTSATIEVAAGQTVISTGPYAIRPPSDVCERAALLDGHPAGARVVLGADPARCHVAVPHVAAV